MPTPDHVQTTKSVYDHSADLYIEKVGTTIDSRFETAADQAALESFAAAVLSDTPGPVLDVGCGPGRATAFLADRGLDVSGIDISEEMVKHARSAHPHLDFEVGAFQALPAEDHSLAGACLWYSIIHTPPAELPDAWTELGRALRPGSPVLVAFQAGDGRSVERVNAHGSAETLVAYHHDADQISDGLSAAGFALLSVTVRQSELEHETTSQAIVIARADSAGAT